MSVCGLYSYLTFALCVIRIFPLENRTEHAAAESLFLVVHPRLCLLPLQLRLDFTLAFLKDFHAAAGVYCVPDEQELGLGSLYFSSHKAKSQQTGCLDVTLANECRCDGIWQLVQFSAMKMSICDDLMIKYYRLEKN